MARWRRDGPDPLASMPAAIAEFDAKEWAAPGETPDGNGFSRGDWASTWDYYRAHGRYCEAMVAWFDAHPDADFLDWLRGKRVRRRERQS
jgi:hypothetical protein